MTDYRKLAEALRCCAGVHTKPTKCPDYSDSCLCGGRCLDEHLITAADAIEALQAEVKWLTSAKDVPTSAYNHGYMDGKNEAEQALEPKRGEWIEENIRPRSSQFVCSECHGKAYYPQPTRDKMWTKRCGYAYCPHCGADMRAKMEVQA